MTSADGPSDGKIFSKTLINWIVVISGLWALYLAQKMIRSFISHGVIFAAPYDDMSFIFFIIFLSVVFVCGVIGLIGSWLGVGADGEAMALLHSKDYKWVTLLDAERLVKRSQRKLIRKLPDRDQLAVTPLYREGDINSISACIDLLSAYPFRGRSSLLERFLAILRAI